MRYIGDSWLLGMSTLFLGACNTLTPAQDSRNDALWDAARSCQYGTVVVHRISNDGQPYVTTFNSGGSDFAVFRECYIDKARPIWRSYCAQEPQNPQCGTQVSTVARGPAAIDKADPISLTSADPRYSEYLRRVQDLISAKMSYPCVKDEAGGCEYKPARLLIEFGLLRDGRVDYVTVITKADWEIFDEYSVNAIRNAAPFPPVPPALMAQATPGSAAVRIRAGFEYKLNPR
jgi:hypothetical protein